MIVVSTTKTTAAQKSKPIRCPKCGHKRVCDISSNIHPRNLKPHESIAIIDSILVKCPRCHISVSLIIQYTNEGTEINTQ